MANFLSEALGRRQAINPIRKALGNALVTLGSGQIPQSENEDALEKLYAKEMIKSQFRPTSNYGYSALDQIPSEAGGLVLGTARMTKDGRYIPTYKKPFSFGDMMPGYEENIQEEAEEPLQAPAPVANEQLPSKELENLEAEYQNILQDPSVDKEDARAIYEQQKKALVSGVSLNQESSVNDKDFEGDLSEFNIDESDRAYLIGLGFSKEDVDLAINAANKRKVGV